MATFTGVNGNNRTVCPLSLKTEVNRLERKNFWGDCDNLNPLNVIVGFSRQSSKIRQDREDYMRSKS